MLRDKIWHFVCRPAVYDGTVALWCIRRTYWAELDFQRPKWETETEDDKKGALFTPTTEQYFWSIEILNVILISQTLENISKKQNLYFHWNS